jgi:hypothetical protein
MTHRVTNQTVRLQNVYGLVMPASLKDVLGDEPIVLDRARS